MSINTNMLRKLMLYQITSVLSDKIGVDIEKETSKSLSNHCSQVTSTVTRTIAHNSASALKQEIVIYFLVFQAMREPPRKIQ
jgi:hypothetical protein